MLWACRWRDCGLCCANSDWETRPKTSWAPNKNGGSKPPSSPSSSKNLLFIFAERWRRRRHGRWICRRSRWGRSLRIRVHTFFEVADTFAEPAHHFRNFLSSEQEDDNRQNDQPMDWAKFSHVYLPSRGRQFNERLL